MHTANTYVEGKCSRSLWSIHLSSGEGYGTSPKHMKAFLRPRQGPLTWAHPVSKANLELYLPRPDLLKFFFLSFSWIIMTGDFASPSSSVLWFSIGFQLFNCWVSNIDFSRQLILLASEGGINWLDGKHGRPACCASFVPSGHVLS